MSEHRPVMLAEVIALLAPKSGGYYIDGTFGGGGYTRAILEAADCRVLGIDRDPEAIARGRALIELFGDRLRLVEAPFSRMADIAEKASDGVVLDLGVSSFQLDMGERGFSFREDGPLDMRMSKSGPTAADFVNSVDVRTLENVIARFGEERQARRIARAIVEKRPIASTRALADLVSDALGPAAKRFAVHPATRTFQALRIHVNDELGELERGLSTAEQILKPEGRLAVVSFHSLEDRIVKHFFVERAQVSRRPSRHAPDAPRATAARFRLITPRPRVPAETEIARNPRARSARLRAAERLAA